MKRSLKSAIVLSVVTAFCTGVSSVTYAKEYEPGWEIGAIAESDTKVVTSDISIINKAEFGQSSGVYVRNGKLSMESGTITVENWAEEKKYEFHGHARGVDAWAMVHQTPLQGDSYAEVILGNVDINVKNMSLCGEAIGIEAENFAGVKMDSGNIIVIQDAKADSDKSVVGVDAYDGLIENNGASGEPGGTIKIFENHNVQLGNVNISAINNADLGEAIGISANNGGAVKLDSGNIIAEVTAKYTGGHVIDDDETTQGGTVITDAQTAAIGAMVYDADITLGKVNITTNNKSADGISAGLVVMKQASDELFNKSATDRIILGDASVINVKAEGAGVINTVGVYAEEGKVEIGKNVDIIVDNKTSKGEAVGIMVDGQYAEGAGKPVVNMQGGSIKVQGTIGGLTTAAIYAINGGIVNINENGKNDVKIESDIYALEGAMVNVNLTTKIRI